MITTVLMQAAGICSENNVVREEDSFQVDLRVSSSVTRLHLTRTKSG